MRTQKAVAVIGAGVAGLAAARCLQQAGRLVTVFDKGRGPGGRISTRRAEAFRFDHGAPFFEVRSEAFRETVEAWRVHGFVDRWLGRTGRVDEVGVATELSVTSRERWVGVPRMSIIARHLSEGLDLRLGVRVSTLDRRANGWWLNDEAGEEHGAFSELVVAVPSPQAVPLLEGRTPLVDVAHGARMVPAWVVMVAFREELGLPYSEIEFANGSLAWAGHDAAKPGRERAATWVLHARLDWTEQELERQPDEVVKGLLAAWWKGLGRDPVEAVHLAAQRWRYARARGEALDPTSLWDGENRVGLAGDAYTGGGVEAAYLSGLRIAEIILAS